MWLRHDSGSFPAERRIEKPSPILSRLDEGFCFGDIMAEMFGITVIDDSHASQKSDEIGVGITAIVRIKHAALYEAAKAMGGSSALARHLGVTPTILGEWINLKACPPKEAGGHYKSWTEERIAIMEAKLEQLTGKSWEELWPDELRENHEFLKSPKMLEKVFNWKQAAMLNYAEATRDRLLTHAGALEEDEEITIEKEAIEKSLHMLTFRERKVIQLRYGFTGTVKTYDEVGVELKITRERVRQIELKAIKRLQYYAGLALVGIETINTPATRSVNDNIDDIGLSVSLLKALRSEGVETIGDLVKKTPSQILKLKHSSQWWLTMTSRALSAVGMRLSEDAKGD